MGSYLWKVTANRNHGKVVKGMMVEILIVNQSGNPSQKDIQLALEKKYSVAIGAGIPGSTFDYEKG